MTTYSREFSLKADDGIEYKTIAGIFIGNQWQPLLDQGKIILNYKKSELKAYEIKFNLSQNGEITVQICEYNPGLMRALLQFTNTTQQLLIA